MQLHSYADKLLCLNKSHTDYSNPISIKWSKVVFKDRKTWCEIIWSICFSFHFVNCSQQICMHHLTINLIESHTLSVIVNQSPAGLVCFGVVCGNFVREFVSEMKENVSVSTQHILLISYRHATTICWPISLSVTNDSSLYTSLPPSPPPPCLFRLLLLSVFVILETIFVEFRSFIWVMDSHLRLISHAPVPAAPL